MLPSGTILPFFLCLITGTSTYDILTPTSKGFFPFSRSFICVVSFQWSDGNTSYQPKTIFQNFLFLITATLSNEPQIGFFPSQISSICKSLILIKQGKLKLSSGNYLFQTHGPMGKKMFLMKHIKNVLKYYNSKNYITLFLVWQ